MSSKTDAEVIIGARFIHYAVMKVKSTWRRSFLYQQQTGRIWKDRCVPYAECGYPLSDG